MPSAVSLTVFDRSRGRSLWRASDRLFSLSLDRTGPSGVQIVSARNGLGADYVVVKAEVARAQKEGERISELTRAALQVRKSQGGNRTNLSAAQRHGARSNALSVVTRWNIAIAVRLAQSLLAAAAVRAARRVRGVPIRGLVVAKPHAVVVPDHPGAALAARPVAAGHVVGASEGAAVSPRAGDLRREGLIFED